MIANVAFQAIGMEMKNSTYDQARKKPRSLRAVKVSAHMHGRQRNASTRLLTERPRFSPPKHAYQRKTQAIASTHPAAQKSATSVVLLGFRKSSGCFRKSRLPAASCCTNSATVSPMDSTSGRRRRKDASLPIVASPQ